MRTWFMSAALAALLVACTPPAQRETEAPTPDQPTVQACNSVAPNTARQVTVEEELAVAAAASDLRGGRITPGTYDLASARRIGAATGWQGTRAVAVEVSEAAAGGVTLNWAGTTETSALDTWTATLTETQNVASLAYTCGRVGEVSADFSATADALELRLSDGGSGRLALTFQRRS